MKMPEPAYHLGEVMIHRETDRAVLVTFDGEDTWIPKSQVHEESALQNPKLGEIGELSVSLWFAGQKGWV